MVRIFGIELIVFRVIANLKPRDPSYRSGDRHSRNSGTQIESSLGAPTQSRSGGMKTRQRPRTPQISRSALALLAYACGSQVELRATIATCSHTAWRDLIPCGA